MVFVKRSTRDLIISKTPFLAVLAALALLPLLGVGGYWLDVLTRVNLFLLVTLAIDLYSGTTYYLNLGISFTFGFAGYALALLNVYYSIPTEYSLLLAIPISVFFSLVILLPSLKIRGVYFAILSLLVPIVYIGIVTAQPFSLYLGGEGGLRFKQLFLDFARSLPSDVRLVFLQYSYYYISLAAAVIGYLVAYKIGFSEFGFMLRAIGQDEELAEGTGINTLKVKIIGYLISSSYVSIAGALYASMRPPVTVDLVVPANTLIPPLTSAIVGGLGTVVGPTIANYLLLLTYELMWGFIGRWRVIVYMLLLITIIVIRPQGLIFKIYLDLKKRLRGVLRE
ncbi:MAG: branched-chain amino acid ABC transporter permease [Zestosphaera sp.]